MANTKPNHALILSALFSNHFVEFSSEYDNEENAKIEIVTNEGMGTSSLEHQFSNGPRDLQSLLVNLGATTLYFEEDITTGYGTEEGDVLAVLDDVLLEIRYNLTGNEDYRSNDNILYIKATVADDQKTLTLMATERIQELMVDFTYNKMREIMSRIQTYQGKKFNNELLIDAPALMTVLSEATRVEQTDLGSPVENEAAVARTYNLHLLIAGLKDASKASMYNVASMLAPNVVKVSYFDVSESVAFKDVGLITCILDDGSEITLSGNEFELDRDDFLETLVDNNGDYFFVEDEHADEGDVRLLEQLRKHLGALLAQDVISFHEIIRELCYQEDSNEFFLPTRTQDLVEKINTNRPKP